MLNAVWLGLILSSILLGGIQGRMKFLSDGVLKGAETAVALSLGLIGVMSLWMGMMRLAEKSGLIFKLARALRPVLKQLFPEVPAAHPAMGSIVMNIAANMLGLVNAATPFGLRAMKDLQSLNPHPQVATNAMCTFLAINTGSVQLIPVTVLAILAGAGAKSPGIIIGTALAASLCSTAAALIAVKSLQRFTTVAASGLATTEPVSAEAILPPVEPGPMSTVGRVLLTVYLLFMLGVIAVAFSQSMSGPGAQQGSVAVLRNLVTSISVMAVPFLIGFFVLYGWARNLAVFDEVVEGAKEGFQVAVRIIPYLVLMLSAVTMFRESGGIDLISKAAAPLLNFLRFPSEVLPLALMRPLSGSASLAIFSDMVRQFGPDHLFVRMGATLYGSTETTFYVLAVYFGSVGVVRTRHALAAGLIADAAGALAAVIICRLVFPL